MSTQKPTPETQNTDKSDEFETDENGQPREFGGYKAEGLPEPTRFGDWEVKGRCSDF